MVNCRCAAQIRGVLRELVDQVQSDSLEHQIRVPIQNLKTVGELKFTVSDCSLESLSDESQSIDKVPNDDGLIAHFESFERAFHSLVGPYFSGKEELDAILHDTNTPAD